MSGLPSYLDRKVTPVTECGCWVWLGSTDKDGYGKTTHTSSGLKRHVRAHRLVYELLVGPIPKGAVLRHSCDVPCCVNPDHMVIGTQVDNIADREKRGRTSRGDLHCCATLTSEQILQIRAAEGRNADIAKKFGITQSHSWLIRNRRIWKHL